MLAACGSRPAPAPVVAEPPARFLPLDQVLRDGVWTLEGPHAVVGRLGADPTLLAVIDEHGDQVRVVHEDRAARVARWVPTADLHLTVLRPVALAGRPDSFPRAEHAAVVLLPGIPVVELRHAGARVEISAGDAEMRAQGWIDADLLGRIWAGQPYPEDPEATHGVEDRTSIFVEPRAAATVVAQTAESATAAVMRSLDGWAEIRIVGSWMNVRGYVEEERLREGAPGRYELSGELVRPAEWPDVPAGACLVESIGGALVGVTTAEHANQEPVPGGAKVPVATPWGTMTPFAEEDGDGWRTCRVSDP